MPTRYALLSTYPPTQCGLATFTAALVAHLPRAGDHVAVVRVLDKLAPRPASEVVHDLVAGSVASAATAADVLNSFDIVIVQHEYGIYGGPDGQEVVSLLEALFVPTIVVLHTVLAHPSPRQRAILNGVIAAADAVVTMTKTARLRLLDIYGAHPEKVFVIPHGAADNRATASSPGVRTRPMVLTWGLLGPGKGIEHAIDAMGHASRSRAACRLSGCRPDPSARAGPRWRGLPPGTSGAGTEPRRGGSRSVRRPVPSGRCAGKLISAADVVLLPYDSPEQVTSGVLIEAVTAGKPVVSTCFPHAVELLGGGAGLLVGRQGPRRHRARTGARAYRARPLGTDEQIFCGHCAAIAVASGSALLPGTCLFAGRSNGAEHRHELPCGAVPASSAVHG